MIVLGRKEAKMRPRKWTETAIQQAFDNFIKQYDRLPTKQEMYEKYIDLFGHFCYNVIVIPGQYHKFIKRKAVLLC